jgi:hypothetical protein
MRSNDHILFLIESRVRLIVQLSVEVSRPPGTERNIVYEGKYDE